MAKSLIMGIAWRYRLKTYQGLHDVRQMGRSWYYPSRSLQNNITLYLHGRSAMYMIDYFLDISLWISNDHIDISLWIYQYDRYSWHWRNFSCTRQPCPYTQQCIVHTTCYSSFIIVFMLQSANFVLLHNFRLSVKGLCHGAGRRR